MTTVSAFVTELAGLTRPERAAAWDPVGLQLGDPNAPVDRVAVCHEVTDAVVDSVGSDPPGLLVAYHPLLFKPTSRLVAGRTPAGRAWALVRAGIALAVTHTDFDVSPVGTSAALAEALGLFDPVGFGPVPGRDQIKIVTFVPADAVDRVVEAMVTAGAGRIGDYTGCSFRHPGTGRFVAGEGANPTVGAAGESTEVSEMRLEMIAGRRGEEAVVAALVAAHPYEEPAFDVYDTRSNQAMIGRVGAWEGLLGELVETVSNRLGSSGLRVAGDLNAPVRQVAAVPGSGGSFIEAAVAAGADALVTGDVDHHRAAAAVGMGLAVIDAGHAATEVPGMASLVSAVAGLGVPVADLTGDGRGPWVELPPLA